jgi:type 2 lantibiotic biosynthesis protein LanM
MSQRKDDTAIRELSSESRLAGFLELVQPLVAYARSRLCAGIARCRASDAFDPDTIEDLLLQGMAEQVLDLIAPTLALELQVARLSDALQGESSEERFDSFIELLRQPEQRAQLLSEYCVLTRLVNTVLQNRVDFGLQFLEHLVQDFPALSETFSPHSDPGHLVGLATGQGDAHRRGRAVVILTFSSGLRLVYKPRSIAVEIHFQEVLAWLNQHGDVPAYRLLKMLSRHSHGWVEFVHVAACDSTEQVSRFYRRQGGYLAVLRALAATDINDENVLAAGEHPILIDLETLFHPVITPVGLGEAAALEAETRFNSVLNVGLLPQRNSAAFELSGSGDQESKLSRTAMPTWEGSGTDRLRRVYQRIPIPATHNQPTCGGTRANPRDYEDEIVGGFRAIYRLLLARRDELLRADGLLSHFAQDTVRVILRPTHTYQLLQIHRLHPDRLRDALEVDRLYEKLWAGVKREPCLARVIAAERHDLHQDDYPYFTTRPDATQLWTSTGDEITDFLAESGLTLVVRRLNEMNERDLATQIDFIRTALCS